MHSGCPAAPKAIRKGRPMCGGPTSVPRACEDPTNQVGAWRAPGSGSSKNLRPPERKTPSVMPCAPRAVLSCVSDAIMRVCVRQTSRPTNMACHATTLHPVPIMLVVNSKLIPMLP